VRRRWVYIAAVPLVVLLGIAGLRLHHEPSAEGVRSQLAFIRAELDGGAAARMQQLFPEGYFFSYLLYGLTWAELARARPEWCEEAFREALWALRHTDSARAREMFPEEQAVPHGVFFAGWTAWLYARVLGIEGAPADALAPRLEELTQQVASALDESPTPFLQAYPGGAWPCDTVVAIAALAEHDRALEGRYAATVGRWLGNVEERLDDSGPLILGVSASASVVMASAAAFYRDEQTADALFGTMELAGLPIDVGAGKRYGFGLLPVGDAFVAWASAAQPVVAVRTH
jgi:hypothetical protein